MKPYQHNDHYCYYAYLLSEVQIQLQNAFYDVNEGNSPLEVCVILTGEIETDIIVTLTTTNITATRKTTRG